MIDVDRLQQVNDMLVTIGDHGRRFFYHRGRYGAFTPGQRGALYYVDKWHGTRLYANYRRGFRRHWMCSEGGMGQDLLRDMSAYIRGLTDAERLMRHLGPFPSWACGGDPWAYREDMTKVRVKCAEILGVEVTT